MSTATAGLDPRWPHADRIALIQRRAWLAAGDCLHSGRGDWSAGYDRGFVHGLLSALYFIDDNPDHTLDLDSLIGARAWADGERSP